MNYPSVLPPGQVRYPLVSVKNVYIFPGIPTLLQRAFNRLKDDLFKSEYQSHVDQVFVTQTEIQIADNLNNLVEKYKDSVTFGSYPTWSHNYYQTKITVEAESAQLVDSVVSELKSQMPTIATFDKFPFADKMDKIAQKNYLNVFMRTCTTLFRITFFSISENIKTAQYFAHTSE